MSGLADFLRNVVGRGPREASPRRSPNGASSFHLIWELPRGLDGDPRLVEVSAVLEVVEPPREKALYFWALQVDLADDRGVWGGGHTGLQWNRRYPEGKAVNWGGYRSPEVGGQVLTGTVSSLPGFPDDLNTMSYAWEPGRPYRLRVYRSPDTPGAWRADVTDLSSGVSAVIRDLMPEPGRGASGSRLTRPLVWSEVFADCEAPSVTVRWSDLEAMGEDGSVVRPEAVRVNYQSPEAGGCSNTTVLIDENGGALQITNVPRVTKQDARLPLSGSARAAQ